MQSERWYLPDHPEYIEKRVAVRRYGGANTKLVNLYVLKDGISPTIQVQPFTSTRDFNYVPTITAASWTQKHEGTGDRGQGNPAERASGLFAFVLRTKARARQKWSAPSHDACVLCSTRVSY